ncbi:hypothetical protein DACRYDRAFT_103486 [Dacryopinax primogenitus]|uniref:Uncharacterized protein n=1 Tax=Dacryopinax primogenitus (strain DJM 731) TaxID=1858805 RepID=M5GC03_DACPD|nr:uncharacterized protein DACRYDRAFT_103486 [Dacryopinax primogenitus]EJU06539.1 hypothetical protein DACRYDRAFT_103486 [Dacryopinax primogenitus]
MTVRSGKADAVDLVIALAHMVNLIITLALLAIIIPAILALHLLVVTVVLGLLVDTIVLALVLLVVIATLACLRILATPPLKAVMSLIHAHPDHASWHAANMQDDFGATHAHNIIEMEHIAPIPLQTPPASDHPPLSAEIDLGPPPQYAKDKQAVVEDVKMGNAEDKDDNIYECGYLTPPPTVPVVKQGWS